MGSPAKFLASVLLRHRLICTYIYICIQQMNGLLSVGQSFSVIFDCEAKIKLTRLSGVMG